MPAVQSDASDVLCGNKLNMEGRIPRIPLTCFRRGVFRTAPREASTGAHTWSFHGLVFVFDCCLGVHFPLFVFINNFYYMSTLPQWN